MTSADAMDIVDGWNAYRAGVSYDPLAPHAWRKGWRWKQAESLRQ